MLLLLFAGGGWRQMVCIDPGTGTLCLNAATVPRVVPLPHSNGEPTLAAPTCGTAVCVALVCRCNAVLQQHPYEMRYAWLRVVVVMPFVVGLGLRLLPNLRELEALYQINSMQLHGR